jgi:hypothetical protein
MAVALQMIVAAPASCLPAVPSASRQRCPRNGRPARASAVFCAGFQLRKQGQSHVAAHLSGMIATPVARAGAGLPGVKAHEARSVSAVITHHESPHHPATGPVHRRGIRHGTRSGCP